MANDGEIFFGRDYIATPEQKRAFREKKIEEGREAREDRIEREKAQTQDERDSRVVKQMIEEDREDSNADGGPQHPADYYIARNDFAARFYARRQHFGFGSGESRS